MTKNLQVSVYFSTNTILALCHARTFLQAIHSLLLRLIHFNINCNESIQRSNSSIFYHNVYKCNIVTLLGEKRINSNQENE